MMFKIRQGLALQKIPKHPGLVRRFLHGHQAFNITESHHPLDPIFLASILEDNKLLRVLGGWVVWIHEKLQLDSLRLVRVRPINQVYLLHLGNKRNGGGVSHSQKWARQRWIWKTYSWPLPGLKFSNRSVITVLYFERKIAIYDLS
jgi:hypothetical protein